MSDAHDRYERFSLARQLSIPSKMLQRASVFEDDDTRSISRVRATRHAFDLPDTDGDGDSAVDEEGQSNEDVSIEASLLPPGYDVRERVTPSGRKYQTFTSAEGKQLRSRLEAWRDYRSRHGTHDAESEYVPYTASPDTPAEPEPAVLFDVVTPGGAGPSNGGHNKRETLSAVARRLSADRRRESSSVNLSLPFGATCSLVELESDQCGNPNCVVTSKNGRHPGDCRFPAPPPRRRGMLCFDAVGP